MIAESLKINTALTSLTSLDLQSEINGYCKHEWNDTKNDVRKFNWSWRSKNDSWIIENKYCIDFTGFTKWNVWIL